MSYGCICKHHIIDSSRIIGEDKALSIKVGAEAGDPSTQDVIMVRGVSADVDRAVKEILQVVEDAKNDAIVSSYVSQFNLCIIFVTDLRATSSPQSSKSTGNMLAELLVRRESVLTGCETSSVSESTFLTKLRTRRRIVRRRRSPFTQSPKSRLITPH